MINAFNLCCLHPRKSLSHFVNVKMTTNGAKLPPTFLAHICISSKNSIRTAAKLMHYQTVSLTPLWLVCWATERPTFVPVNLSCLLCSLEGVYALGMLVFHWLTLALWVFGSCGSLGRTSIYLRRDTSSSLLIKHYC